MPSAVPLPFDTGLRPAPFVALLQSPAAGGATPGVTEAWHYADMLAGRWKNWPDQSWALWPMTYSLGPGCRPSAYEWPVPEAYFDIYLYPATNEYTVDVWTPNVYVWGYLAGRK